MQPPPDRRTASHIPSPDDDFRAFANAMPHVVWTATAQGHIDYLNTRWCSLTGATAGESRQDAWMAALHPDDRRRFSEAWRNAVTTGQRLELDFRIWSRSHAEHRWKRARAQRMHDAAGRAVRWIGSCHDIHDQTIVETSLRITEARLRRVIDESPVGIVILDQDARPLYYNRKCAELRGHEVQTSEWARAIHPDDRQRVVELAVQAAQHGLPWSGTYRFVHPDGTIVWVSARTVPIQSDNEHFGFVRTLEDITELKRDQEKLRRLNQELQDQVQDRSAKVRDTLAEFDRLSYSIVHDMRAPLRSLQGFSDLLLEQYADRLDDQGKGFLRRIAASAERQDRLIQDVLSYHSFIRKDFPLAQVDLDELVTHIIETYAGLQQPHVDIQVQHPLGRVLAHQTLLTQCVSALLDNAAKFVPRGVKPEIRIWSEQTATEIKLWIKDNGIGIHPDYHEKIFDIFATLHSPGEYSGTGIGLPLAKKALERMGGSIGVHSNVGQGAQFWITLQRAP